jgi:hypothetical protein
LRLKRIAGDIVTLAGWCLLALAVLEIVLAFYYRPTLEYAGAEGAAGATPSWLTGESAGVAVGALLTGLAAALLWSGHRWRRR